MSGCNAINHIYINQHLEVGIENGVVRAFVDGKSIVQCMYLVADIELGTKMALETDSIDDLQAKTPFQHAPVASLEEQLQAHASNIQAWAENDYNPRILHSNIAFPLLKALAEAGDEKAARVAATEVDERSIHGTTRTRQAILNTFPELLSERGWQAMIDDAIVARASFFSMVSKHAKNGNIIAKGVVDNLVANVATCSPDIRHEIIMAMPDVMPEIAWLALIDDMANEKHEWVKHDMIQHLKYIHPVAQKAFLSLPMKDVEILIARKQCLTNEVTGMLVASKKFLTREAIAGNTSVPVDMLAHLVKDTSDRVKMELAMNENATAEMLDKLSRCKHHSIKASVARNKNTSPETLRFLSTSNDGDVRIYVTMNKNTPVDVLRSMAHDDVLKGVRVSAFEHFAGSVSRLLNMLAKHPDPDARMVIARNESIKNESIEELRDDPDETIRVALASNPRTSQDVLTAMSGDPSADVRAAVAGKTQRKDVLRAMAGQSTDLQVLRAIASNDHAPPGVLAMLSTSDDAITRANVAANRNAPIDVMNRLFADKEKIVRLSVLQNTSTAPILLVDFLEKSGLWNGNVTRE